MREIKFKIYDPVTKEMLWFEDGSFTLEHLMLGCYPDGLIGSNSTESGIDNFLREDLIWLQYTGLKDKNGKEIYEGDILRIIMDTDEDAGVHQVVGPAKTYPAFDLKPGFSDECNNLSEMVCSDGVANYFIVGNIYENQGEIDV